MKFFPDLLKDADVKALGRWKGDSFRFYIRNPAPGFGRSFELFSDKLLKNFSRMRRKEKDEMVSTPDPQ